MHTVIETDAFMRSAKAAGISEEERFNIVRFLSENPEAGDLIQGTGGARKVRFAYGGKGKSGGVRVVTYYCADDVPIFLLEVYKKGEKLNLSKAERNEVKDTLFGLADAYREGMRRKVAHLTEKAS